VAHLLRAAVSHLERETGKMETGKIKMETGKIRT
jgi:hypothetical protein